MNARAWLGLVLSVRRRALDLIRPRHTRHVLLVTIAPGTTEQNLRSTFLSRRHHGDSVVCAPVCMACNTTSVRQ
jgi:hypothetical protein